MDGIGSIDVISFDEDSVYRQYKWFTSSQVLNQTNYGSYHVIKDTVFCKPLSTQAQLMEFVVIRVDKKYKLARNEKVYNSDGTFSKFQMFGRYGDELTKEQYKQFKAIRAKN